MHRIALFLAVPTFFLNPGIACSPVDDEAHFQYGEAEMRAAVEGTWQIDLLASNGSQSNATVQIVEATERKDGSAFLRSGKQRGLIRSAAACGGQSFIKSAGACTTESRLALEVAYVSGDQRFQNAGMSGDFMIGSETLIPGRLELQLGDVRVSATVTPKGTASDLYTYASEGTTVAALTRLSM
jgi:hypothetical protein